MSHLLRSFAPIPSGGWDLLDSEAKEHLTNALAARKLVDFAGPKGWDYSATNLGRTDPVSAAPVEGVAARSRRVLPLVELRVPFSVSREELENAERGAVDVNLDSLDDAARQIALAENIAVFHGWGEAGFVGVAQASPHPTIAREPAIDGYPRRVAKAVELLHAQGIDGPYGLALSPEEYTSVIETTEHGGYPLFDHLGKILSGPIVWAPGVQGGVVLSLRGDDFLFESGQDLAIGYDHHDAESIYLYFEETFSFRVATPEAAVVLS
ncbi:MAG TPA: family 1 encapsulin nanocompartment shell protein [Mycobacteriales bacterium]|nr:family 1 encapsulin nanocompartment shell protein [Mycobacteriales bacterium]